MFKLCFNNITQMFVFFNEIFSTPDATKPYELGKEKLKETRQNNDNFLKRFFKVLSNKNL